MKKNLFTEPVHKNEKTRFIPPTIEQVKKQFLIKGVSDQKQPLLFMAYYESIDWHVGNKKMRFYKAAISGWILRMDTKQRKKPNQFNNIHKKKPMKSPKSKELIKINVNKPVSQVYPLLADKILKKRLLHEFSQIKGQKFWFKHFRGVCGVRGYF